MTQPELGSGPLDARLWLIGRDYGSTEAARRQPFCGPAGDILNGALRSAGLSRATVRVDNLVPRQPRENAWELHNPADIAWGKARLTALLEQWKPTVIVAFGNEVARFLIGDAYPDDGIQALRGYLWDTRFGRVLTSVHPAAILRDWTPWRALLDFDMRRARAEAGAGAPPLAEREVTVVTDEAQVWELHAAMQISALTGVDIENTRENQLACVGFAPTPERAWVIPAHEDWQMRAIRWLCESPAPKVLQNGQYDRFFLRWFNDIVLKRQTFDVMLGWHALNPELAGKSVQLANRKARSGRTAKSLKFLASIYTRDRFWKSYDFAAADEQYVLNGKDCCITLDIAQKQAAQLAQQNLRHIHDFEVELLDPFIEMTVRGLRVDEPKRLAMLAALDAEHAPLTAETEATALAMLAEHAERIPAAKAHLFRERKVCACCRNGKGKKAACWKCAGYASKPTKKQLKERSIVASSLLPCAVCAGAGAFERAVFNPASPQQVAIILYDVLKLPKRTSDGKVTTDEEALKSLLAGAKPEVAKLIRGILRLGKLGTISEVLTRVAPGPDGRIRTVYNPAGTVTGRPAAAETFLVVSTNLSNLPKREVSEPMFDVKSVFVPDDGCVFVEADLSGAEAWIAAAAAGDTDLIDKLKSGFRIHEWTAAHVLTGMGKPTRMEDVTREGFERQVFGKVPRHALGYGMQPKTLQAEINFVSDVTGIAVTLRQASMIYDSFHALHPTLEVWWRRVLNQIVGGTVTTIFGRKRTLYGRGRGEWLSETHRSAIAQEPQSTIADLLNRGLLRWWRQHDGKLGELRAQVYDSVLIQCKRSLAPVVVNCVRRCLTEEITVHGVKLTIPVDVKVLESWAVLHD